MKQCIEWEQLDELSDRAKKQLDLWWSQNYRDERLENGDDFYCEEDYCEGHTPVYSYASLLSIGQMIEFLDEYFGGEKRDFDIRIHSAGTGWQRPGERLADIPSIISVEIEDEVELCDALWEAVKQVLEKKS